MTEKSNPRPVLGFTDRETVKLDFDDMSFKQVKFWAFGVSRWFRLKGFVVLKSSRNRYHVVFDRAVSWEMSVKIIAWACLLSKHKGLTGWFILQCIKQGSTLRVSPKKQKPTPRIVYRHGTQTRQIPAFLQYRQLAKTILTKLEDQTTNNHTTRTSPLYHKTETTIIQQRTDKRVQYANP